MLLEVESVSAFRGGAQALFDVSIGVAEGETVAVIGANGAGKSTLLRTVCGLTAPATGRVSFAGRTLGSISTRRRLALGIAMVPQGRRIFPGLTVHEHLLVGASAKRPGPWSPARAYDLFPILAGKKDRRGSALSGAEQQALAIGRALAANPRLLLLDEVSLGLASIVVKRLYGALPRVVEGGTAVVLVEQDVGLALAAAGRVYCLRDGRVALEGRSAEMTRAAITAAYFGVPA